MAFRNPSGTVVDANTDATGNLITTGSNGSTTSPSTSVASGTLSVSTVTTLPSQTCSEVEVQNDPSSPANLLIGSGSAQALVLRPGEGRVIPVNNANLINVKAASGTITVNWFSRS
jgi:hypothetical protein